MRKFMWLIAGLSLACNLSAQVEPNAGQWKTWVIASGGALRLPVPPDADGTAAEIQWLKDCVAKRNQAVLAQIHFWDAGAPAYRWMQLAQQLAVSEGLPTPLQTRALSLVAAAIYDSTVAAWSSKYAYMRQHPSEIDPTVTTVITPTASPSYPSEHAVTAGAAATVLAFLFPDQASSLAEMANQAGQSRILAGVAFPSDVISGMDLGTQVGQAAIAYAKADGSTRCSAAHSQEGPVSGAVLNPLPRWRARGIHGYSRPATNSAQARRRKSARAKPTQNTPPTRICNARTPLTTWPGSGSLDFSSRGCSR